MQNFGWAVYILDGSRTRVFLARISVENDARAKAQSVVPSGQIELSTQITKKVSDGLDWKDAEIIEVGMLYAR